MKRARHPLIARDPPPIQSSPNGTHASHGPQAPRPAAERPPVGVGYVSVSTVTCAYVTVDTDVCARVSVHPTVYRTEILVDRSFAPAGAGLLDKSRPIAPPDPGPGGRDENVEPNVCPGLINVAHGFLCHPIGTIAPTIGASSRRMARVG